MLTMHEHWLFAGNALSHWVASMSSIVSFTLGIVELVRNKKIESWIFFAIAGLFLIVGFDQAWQDEHRNSEVLKVDKSSAISEREFWKQQSYDKDHTIQQRDQLLGQNYTALVGEQTTSNQTQQSLTKLADKILAINKPVPQKFVIRREDDAPKFETYKHRGQFIVMTNLPAAARIMVRCEQNIDTLDARIIEGGPRFPGAFGQVDPRTWIIRIPSPQITSQNPLIINVGYNTDSLGLCELGPQ